MKLKLVALGLTIALSATSLSANAATEGWTIGGFGSYATLSDDSDGAFANGISTGFQLNDKKGYGLGLYGEYNFNDWFGLGAEFSYLSGYDVNAAVKYGNYVSIANFDADLYQVQGYARFSHTFDKNGSDIFVKTGFASTTVDLDDDTASSVGFLLGIGAQYSITDKLAVRASYDYIFNAIDDDVKYAGYTVGTLKGNMGKFNLGLNYHF